MAKFNDSLDAQIQHKILTGDAHPSQMATLQRELRRPRRGGSDQNVNVSAGVGATKGGWIGLNLYLMAPTQEDAEEIIPKFVALLREYEFNQVASAMEAMLKEAAAQHKAKTPEYTDADLWPEQCPPLRRGRW